MIDASLRLFAERGFRATTIADIAAATGTAHGLVYHYFRSKDELLEAILERHAFLPRLRSILAVAKDRPAATVLMEIAVDLSADSAEHESWKRPIRTYFRRTGSGWKLIGLERMPENLAQKNATRTASQ